MHLPKPTGNADFAPPPAGTFPGICYRILDLGTQDTTFQGENKEQHKIMLSWEIRDDEAVMTDGRPMTIHQRYTWSMHEKALLRKHLESWRGKKFVESDFGEGGFDVRKLLGVSCMLAIVHAESGGKTFANIAAISKLPKSMNAGQLHNATMFLWLSREGFDQVEFEKLSDGIKTTIKKSPEYHDMMTGSGAETRAARGMGSMVDDEIPF